MAKTSIYLPDDLAEQVRAHGISISEVVQRALRQAVREAKLTEKVMTDVEAVAQRLNLQREKNAEASRIEAAERAARARAYGTKWAQTTASAEEIEYVAMYDGPVSTYRTPISLIGFVSNENEREHKERTGQHGGRPGASHVPTAPNYPYWPDLQAAVREVWDQVKPLLIEIDEHGQNVPTGSGGFSEKVNPAYRLWELREPGADAPRAEWDAYMAEEPDEFL